MRKQEIQFLDQIQKVQKNQIYLMETPKTPQQQFLHLFAHRHLLKQNMIHKNIDRVLNLLEGSFAQSSLKLAYIELCISNQIELAEDISQLLDLIHGWVDFYPTINRSGKVLLTELILQDKTSVEEINGYDVYLHYLNLISTDLWKLLKKTKNNDAFPIVRPFKEQYNEWFQIDVKHLDATDLLTFVSSCLPKVVLNIILEKQSLPAQMRQKYAKFQCLFSNQAIQYRLRTNSTLILLLKQIFLALFVMDLSTSQQKFLMLLAIKYYYAFHFDRKHSAAQIFVFAFNKLNEQVRQNLKDQYVLFVKIIQKLGKVKFMSFLEKNSTLLKELVAQIRKKPTIGYTQDTAAPYNTIGVGQTIKLERGASTCRYFEILEEYSIFYYRIAVKSLDITVRLYYMGEIGSQKQTKTLLLTQEKRSGQIKNCVNAMKKGIYMFEFDNTYSWINGKNLKYENVIYTPLEIKAIDCDQWIEDFYENIFQNIIVHQEDIYVVQKRLVPKQPETNNRANISKKEGSLSLAITKPNQIYEYQTDNPERMQQKISIVTKSKEELLWTIENKPVTYHSDILAYLRGPKAFKTLKQQPQKPKVQIVEKYQEQSDEEKDQVSAVEYEVVQRQLDQSQIFNQAITTDRSTKVSQQELNKSEQQRKKDITNKQQILCNAEEAAQFYAQDQK